MANLATLTYTFQTGVGVRLIRVDNPREAFLIARFNVPMQIDDNFRYAPNWTVVPLTVGGRGIVIDSVEADAGRPLMAMLRYTGGSPGPYRLTVSNTESAEGEALIAPFNQGDFELAFATREEPSIQLFQTIFGTIGLEKRKVTRRTVDQMVINRAIALGMDEQMRLRLGAIQGTGLPESGGPGARRT